MKIVSISVVAALVQLVVSLLMMFVVIVLDKASKLTFKLSTILDGIVGFVGLSTWIVVLTHITLIAILIQFVANIPLLVMIMFWLKQINRRNQSKKQEETTEK